MTKNIFIIDDSALMRRVLSDIINSDERFHVAKVATNGLEALNIMLDRAKEFDAVLLDINMPKMNGLEFLEKLNEHNIKATVIVVSTVAKQDAKETIRALELGAFDFVTKPESFLEVKNNLFSDRILKYLTLATRAEKKCKVVADDSDDKKDQTVVIKKTEVINKSITKPQLTDRLVALACSTGGPKALHAVIPKLPANLDAGVLVVQHMPGGFTKSLADRLNEISEVEVKEAEDGEILKKGTVYIAKGGYQMRLLLKEDGLYHLSVTKEPARHGLLPCADILYESLVDTNFKSITCVVLTGMGGDGTAGIMKLSNNKKIYVIAQNEETSIVYGMPKVIKDAGLVNEVVALNDVSDAIIKNVGCDKWM